MTPRRQRDATSGSASKQASDVTRSLFPNSSSRRRLLVGLRAQPRQRPRHLHLRNCHTSHPLNQAEVSNIRQRRLAGHVTPPTPLADWGIHPVSRRVASRVEEVWRRHEGKQICHLLNCKIPLRLNPSRRVDGIIVISFSLLFDLHPFDVRH